MTLARFDNDGLELVIDTVTGETFATISGYARMAGKDRTTISKRIARDKIELKSAQIPTAGGMQGGELISEDVIAHWITQDNPELATKMLLAGVRLYLHGLAGFKYEVKQESPQPQINPALMVARECHEIKSLIDDNPRLAQLLIDSTINFHLGQKQLSEPQYRGVVEIAEEIGYKVNHSNRGQLGKFIIQQGFEPKKEKRLVNGTHREVNCYPDTNLIRQAIAVFFS